MSTTKKHARGSCTDCGAPSRGIRCREHDREHRAKIHAAKPKRVVVREKPAPRPKYVVPEPSPDRRPLTIEEGEEALCAQVGDRDLFFAEKGISYAPAEKICAACPIAQRCLAAHLDDDYGFYAASPPARQRIRKQLRADVTT